MATRALPVVFNLCRWRRIWFQLLLLKVDAWRWFLKFPSPQDTFESLSEARGPDVKTFCYARPAVVCRLCLVSLSSIWLDDFNIGHVQRSEGFFFPWSDFQEVLLLASVILAHFGRALGQTRHCSLGDRHSLNASRCRHPVAPTPG